MPKYIAWIFAVSMVALASAQDRNAFGLYGQYALNMHTANFQQLPGIPNCCPRFEIGTGPGLAFGVLYDVPLTSLYAIQVRAGYRDLSAELSSVENTTVLNNGSAAPGEFTHTMASTLTAISVEPIFVLRPFGNFRINLGLSAGITLTHRYEQREQITQPVNSGTFLDSLGNDTQRRTRNESSGEIPDASAFHVGLLGGISYMLPVNAQRTLFVAPEVMYILGITPVVSGLSWHANAVRFGVSILYSPAHDSPINDSPTDDESPQQSGPVVAESTPVLIEPPPSPLTPKPLPVRAPVRASFAITALESSGNEIPIAQLRVDEFASTLLTSFLNYVFFDENSATLPNRYHTLDASETDTFNIDRNNSTDKLKTYYHVLNIVGRRLRDNPASTITLTGCNQDIREEEGNLILSRNRALAVKQYLSNVWLISEKRIVIEERNLPQKAANTTMQDGAQENRRVELTSNDARILEPIVTHDTLRTPTTPSIRVRPRITSDVPIDTWRLTYVHAGVTLHTVENKGLPPAFIDWDIESSLSVLMRSGADVTCTLSVTNADTSTALSIASLPIDRYTIQRKQTERLGDKEIDRYSLVLFDVRSADVSVVDLAFIDLIKTKIQPQSVVRVIGYSDRLGDAKYNQQLAENRARSVANLLGSHATTVEGRGSANLYESSLPEGRLYTRTVDIVVETPLR